MSNKEIAQNTSLQWQKAIANQGVVKKITNAARIKMSYAIRHRLNGFKYHRDKNLRDVIYLTKNKTTYTIWFYYTTISESRKTTFNLTRRTHKSFAVLESSLDINDVLDKLVKEGVII